MRQYEGLFIFPPEEGPDASKGEEKRLEDAIARCGGRIVDKKDWGRQPLGYKLRKFVEGRILLWNFELEPLQVAELKKTLNLDEKILKVTLTKYQEPKPAEAPKAPRPQPSYHASKP